MPGPTTRPDFAPVSYTAEKILQKRAFYTSIPHARAMADALGVHWQVSPLRRTLRRLVWGEVKAGRYIQFRYDAISDALRDCPDWGVLEIAAGYSTRGIDESPRRECYVESDLPDLIARKPALVAAIVAAPRANHHFTTFNLCARADVEATGRLLAGLHLQRPLAVIHEGLLMYLDRDEQKVARDHIRWLLATCSPQGVWVTPDFSERDQRGSPMQRLLTRRLVRRTQREFHRFADNDAVHTFLREGGLRGEQLPNLRAGDADAEARASGETARAWRIRLA
jgi:O-methyltransferase involved in polyketide biosynthesis